MFSAIAAPARVALRSAVRPVAPATWTAARGFPSAAGGDEYEHLLVEVLPTNKVAIIRLNRPKALNALDLEMIRILQPSVSSWSASTAPVVVFKGEGPKAFCAGGDIKTLYESRDPSGKPSAVQASFFREEYTLDFDLATLPDRGVTQVVLYDGITMGGGVGLSMFAPFRVATEATVFAMPETAIGFFPDVGGSFFLPRLPGKVGMYLALTGARVKGEEAVSAGLATHFVPQERLGALEDDLMALGDATREDVFAVLSTFAEEVTKPSSLTSHREAIDECFGKATVEEILAALEAQAKSSDADTADWAAKTLKTLSRMSPTSLKVTHRQIQEGSGLSLHECFKMEYRMAVAFMQGNDFYEGVRSVLVDKTKPPAWDPSTLEGVTDDVVAKHFAPTASAGLDEWDV